MAAYNFADLVDELKGKGLDIAEEAAMEVVEATFDWVMKSALASENKFDDVLVAIIPLIKSEVLKAVDKIDGEVDLPQE